MSIVVLLLYIDETKIKIIKLKLIITSHRVCTVNSKVNVFVYEYVMLSGPNFIVKNLP